MSQWNMIESSEKNNDIIMCLTYVNLIDNA